MLVYSFLATHYICYKLKTLALLFPAMFFALLKQLLALCKSDRALVKAFLKGFFQFTKQLPKLAEYKIRVQKERLIKSDMRIFKMMVGSSLYLNQLENDWGTTLRSLKEKEIQSYVSYIKKEFPV